MRSYLETKVKLLARAFDLRVSRGASRPIQFDGSKEALYHVKALGYRPSHIIDGGAHLGAFTALARSAFPDAQIFMVEPQKACAASLTKIAGEDSSAFFVPYLLGSADHQDVYFIDDGDVPTTGARFSASAEPTYSKVTQRTLDSLFTGEIRHPTLLKLDLQGHELEALQGGRHIIQEAVDLILLETSCFVEHQEPTSLTIMNFLDEMGFDLFDIVSMGRRTRDRRLRQIDMLFCKRESQLYADRGWY